MFKQQVYGKFGSLFIKPPREDGLIIKMSFQNIFEKLMLTPVKLRSLIIRLLKKGNLMKLHLLCLTMLSYLMLSGCQSTQPADSTVESVSTASIEVPESKDLDPDGIVCTYEKIVGKLIKEKICYTRKHKMELR